MFGQGCFEGDVDFVEGGCCVCAGVVGVVEVELVEAVDWVGLAPLAAPVVVPVDAEAPAMPAAAPPVASAPATIVAPSIFESCMGWNLLGMGVCVSFTILRAEAKRTRRGA
jgi:hypothetical protein